ncbi:hypothetical protein KR084_008686 [Drosophila pseudotakahashii]|nr:hypothetical protein KR084_008686 [Drosophila pseudotakahashii]
MCCLLEQIFKIFVIMFGIVFNGIVMCFVLAIFGDIINGTNVLITGLEHCYLVWTFHSYCGSLMIVVKIKDLCYLHWWLLMTSFYILAGIILHLVLLDFHRDNIGTTEKIQNYFGLGI